VQRGYSIVGPEVAVDYDVALPAHEGRGGAHTLEIARSFDIERFERFDSRAMLIRPSFFALVSMASCRGGSFGSLCNY